MKNSSLSSLSQALQKALSLPGAQFAYVITKNINLIQKELDIFDKMQEFKDNFKQYEDARIELCKEMSDKKEDWITPIIDSTPWTNQWSYRMTNIDSFNKKLTKLMKDNQEAIDERTKQMEDYNKFMGQESDIAFHKIKKWNLPENITGEILLPISDILE